MIHGGGYMTLSRKAIRPHQTAHLLANGILPVSIDYRLCPEVNVLDGAISDVRDSVFWVQHSLPKFLERTGIELDASRVGVIGWSAGGHLALTSAWTTRASGIQPPRTILSFYAPTDFESEDIDADRKFPERTISIHDIRTSLLAKPLTNYESKGDAKYLKGVGFMRPSDPRSALVLSMFKEGIGLQLILDGIPPPNSEGDTVFKRPDAARVESISPLAQVRKGNFCTPTCVVHSKVDNVVSIDSADRFMSALREAGVEHKFVRLDGREHLHDLLLNPGSRQWDEEVGPAYDFFLEILLR
jgi:acetyl esterase/lipase